MNPAAPTANPNPTNGVVPSSQLGGGANGDASKINGDQIIQNPLSNQVVDQKQAQEALQVAATNAAQVVNNQQQKIPPQAPAQPAQQTQAPQQIQMPVQQPAQQQPVQQASASPQQIAVPPQNQQQPPQQPVQQPVVQQASPQPVQQQAPQQQPVQQVVQAPVQQPPQIAQPVQVQAVPQQMVQSVQPAQQVVQQPAAQQPQQVVQQPMQPVQQASIQQPAPQQSAAVPQQQVVQQAQQVVQQTPQQSVQPGQPQVTVGDNRDQIQVLEDIVAASSVPDDLRKLIRDRIERLKQIKLGAGYMSQMYILEYEGTSRYINWCVGLPWNIKTQDLLDLKQARAILDKHHYGLEPLKNRVLEFIASIMLNLQNNGPDFASRSPILCFVGLAGTGKTTFAISMAEALGRAFERIPFGGMADSRVLRGQSRFYPDAEPGEFIKRLSHAKAKNPVILLDEIDRVTETARADIMGVLIEALDPEQNARFTDHYIDYPFSLANSLFVATSNNISTIATAVIDRMEIIQMPSYNDQEKIIIGKNYVLPKTRAMIGLRQDQLTIDDTIWEGLVRPLGYDPGVRGLDRIINMMCRKAAKLIVSGDAQNVRITPDNVKKFTQDI